MTQAELGLRAGVPASMISAYERERRHPTWAHVAAVEGGRPRAAHSPGGRVRRRIGDKRVVGLVKAFLKAGIFAKDLVAKTYPRRSTTA